MYNKIFTKILDSSIWLEADPTRIVWITMIAAMDEDGFCHFASVENLARRAVVDVEKAKEAVRVLEAPDSNSCDPDHEGRRIERVPGGWIVLNSKKYKELVTRVVAREQTRQRVARYRDKKALCNAPVTVCNDLVTPSETVSVSNNTSAQPKAGRVRDPLFDALAIADGSNPTELTKAHGKRIGVALAEIRKASPDVTAAEIARRSRIYASVMPAGTRCTAPALAANWAKCGGTYIKTSPREFEVIPAPPADWRIRLEKAYPENAVNAENRAWDTLDAGIRRKVFPEIFAKLLQPSP